jgi:hypothetical protein
MDFRTMMHRFARVHQLRKPTPEGGRYVDGRWVENTPVVTNVRLALVSVPERFLRYDEGGTWQVGDVLVLAPAHLLAEQDTVVDLQTNMAYSVERLRPVGVGLIQARGVLLNQAAPAEPATQTIVGMVTRTQKVVGYVGQRNPN